MNPLLLITAWLEPMAECQKLYPFADMDFSLVLRNGIR
jgi:hypothetical protein